MSHRPQPTFDPDDEEIDRIRAVRHRISERFGHDPYRLVAYYMELQRQHQDRLVHAAESQAVDAGDTRPPQRR